MQHTTSNFTGQGNVPIFTQQWLPEDTPRAVILISHGYAEHSGRYAHVAAFFVAQGYAVYALDHQGHGQSGGPRTQIGTIAVYVAELRQYFQRIRTSHPDLPVVLYGHSMGSLIALLFAERYQGDLAGLITTGTALATSNSPALITLVKLLAMLPLNGRVLPKIPAAALSHDPKVVQAYIDDPLVDTRPMRFDMAGALAHALEHAKRALPSLRLPYLALHGGEDAITLPEGAEIARKWSGSADTTVKLYDGLYHEIHNEPEQEQVLQDIAAWLDQRV